MSGVKVVADDPGAAAHIGALGVRIAGLIILQIKGSIQEGEIGEQPLGGGFHGQTEQVVVGVAGVIVDAFLDLEDLHREDAGLSFAQPGLCGLQQGFHDHPSLRGGVGAVVDGGKGHLCAGSCIHKVQIVEESFHGLIGFRLGLLACLLGGEGLSFLHIRFR